MATPALTVATTATYGLILTCRRLVSFEESLKCCSKIAPATIPPIVFTVAKSERKDKVIKMKWEYKTVDWGEIRKIGSRVTGEDFIEANVDAGLNSLGQDGWELVGVYVDGYAVHRTNKGEELLSSSRYVKYTFKRPHGES
jgi:hypothetical protein